MFDQLLQDFHFARRKLLDRPAVTVLIVLTLGLGIGANSAIFSVVHDILLSPLPFVEPERLVRLETSRGGEVGPVSLRELEDLRAETEIFEGLAAYVPGILFNVGGEGRPEEVPAILPTHDLFAVLGVEPALGAPWPAAHDRERHLSVILGHDLWQRRFGGDPEIVGRQITLDGAAGYTVFGVAPEGFSFPGESEVYRSIFLSPHFPGSEDRQARRVVGIGRLAQGVSVERARAELEAFGERLARQYPSSNEGLGFRLTPLAETFSGEVRPYLLLLLGAVGLVLLITCVNVSNLLLSRAVARETEMAVRAALGARRRRLLAQLLVESLVLASLGALAGLVVAYFGVDLLARWIRREVPPFLEVGGLDLPVLFVTLGVAVVASVGAGLAPALRLSAASLIDVGRGVFGGSRRQGLRGVLVVAEVALAVVLLAGAGLLFRSFRELAEADLGFRDEGVLTFRVALPWTYDRTRTLEFHRRVLEELEALPGVESAAINSNLPLGGLDSPERSLVAARGQSEEEQRANPYVTVQRASPGYFRTLDIPVLAGRLFDERDHHEAPRVVVVGRHLAERLWPGGRAVGQQLRRIAHGAEWMEVVGVVGNVRHSGVDAEPGFDVYISALQVPEGWNHFVIHTTGDPEALTRSAMEAVWSVDDQQAVFDIATMEERVGDSLWRQRTSAVLFGAFALLALVLATTGIYGVMAFLVGQRRREIGIRISLGAATGQILRRLLRDGLRLAATGLAVGIAASLLFGRSIAHWLYGITPTDPATYAAVCVLLLAVALAASWLPARRALRIDPMKVLREE